MNNIITIHSGGDVNIGDIASGNQELANKSSMTRAGTAVADGLPLQNEKPCSQKRKTSVKKHLRSSITKSDLSDEVSTHTVGELIDTSDILRLCHNNDKVVIPSLPEEINSDLLPYVIKRWTDGAVYQDVEDVLYFKTMPDGDFHLKELLSFSELHKGSSKEALGQPDQLVKRSLLLALDLQKEQQNLTAFLNSSATEQEKYAKNLYTEAVMREEQLNAGQFLILLISQQWLANCKIVVQAPSETSVVVQQALGADSEIALPVSYMIDGETATMGLYMLTNTINNERPVYKQLNGKYYLYFYKSNVEQWRIGDINSNKFWLKVNSTDKVPPTEGYSHQWGEPTSNMVVKKNPVNENLGCKAITFSAAEHLSKATKYLGNYQFNGKWRNGLKVYKHDVHDIFLTRLSSWWLFGKIDSNLFTCIRFFNVGKPCPGNSKEIKVFGPAGQAKGAIKTDCVHGRFLKKYSTNSYDTVSRKTVEKQDSYDEDVEEISIEAGKSASIFGSRGLLTSIDQPLSCSVSLVNGVKYNGVFKDLGQKFLKPISYVIDYKRKPMSQVQLKLFHHLSSIDDSDKNEEIFSLIAFEYNHNNKQVKQTTEFKHDEEYVYIIGKPNCSVGLAIKGNCDGMQLHCCLILFRIQSITSEQKCLGHSASVFVSLKSQQSIMEKNLKLKKLEKCSYAVWFDLSLTEANTKHTLAIENEFGNTEYASVDLTRLLSEGYYELGNGNSQTLIFCNKSSLWLTLQCSGICKHGTSPIFEQGLKAEIPDSFKCNFNFRQRPLSSSFDKEGIAIILDYQQKSKEGQIDCSEQISLASMFKKNSQSLCKWYFFNHDLLNKKQVSQHIVDSKLYFDTISDNVQNVFIYCHGQGTHTESDRGDNNLLFYSTADAQPESVTDIQTKAMTEFPAAKVIVIALECVEKADEIKMEEEKQKNENTIKNDLTEEDAMLVLTTWALRKQNKGQMEEETPFFSTLLEYLKTFPVRLVKDKLSSCELNGYHTIQCLLDGNLAENIYF